MRKTLCAFVLTLILSGVALAGEIPNGKNDPPPPPPPGGGFASVNDQTDIKQSLDETILDDSMTDYILSLMRDILALY